MTDDHPSGRSGELMTMECICGAVNEWPIGAMIACHRCGEWLAHFEDPKPTDKWTEKSTVCFHASSRSPGKAPESSNYTIELNDDSDAATEPA